MQINTLIILGVMVPLTTSLLIIYLSTIIPLSNNNKHWYDLTINQINSSTLNTTEVKLNYIGKYIETYFKQTSNDMTTMYDYIKMSINNELKIKTNYENYFGVSSIDSRIPQKDFYNNFWYSSTYMNGITSSNSLNSIDTYILNNSTIYDNVMRAVFMSSKNYVGLYYGFELNGFYRYYPYVNFNAYPLFTSTCARTGLQITGYDPRCRGWYEGARFNDDVYFTSPYNDALTGDVMITISKRVMKNNDLQGVIGFDFSMSELDEIIKEYRPTQNGKAYLMSENGELISYDGINRNSVENILNIENGISSNIWNRIFISKTTSVKSIQVKNNDEDWIINYLYLDEQKYYIVSLYPLYDINLVGDVLTKEVNDLISSNIIVLSVISVVLIVISGFLSYYFGNKYTVAIRAFGKSLEDIKNPDLDIELGNSSHVSLELSSATNNFKYLLSAVRSGNNAYMSGDLKKAQNDYDNCLKLMHEMKNPRGESVCLNNLGNVYKQLGDNTKARELYLQSIKIIDEQMRKEVDKKKQSAYKVMISYRLMNLGVLQTDMGNFMTAEKTLKEAFEMSREADNLLGISKISGNLGQLYIKWNRLDEARTAIDTGYEIVMRKHDMESIQYAMLNKGLLEIAHKNYDMGGGWFRHILTTIKDIDIFVRNRCLEELRKIFEMYGKMDEVARIDTEIGMARKDTYLNKNVLFVLDISGSMSGSFLSQCKASIAHIINTHLGDKDNISMITFNNTITKVFSRKIKTDRSVMDSIMRLSADGQTAFYDALVNAIHDAKKKESTHESWIISLTDGADNSSSNTSNSVINVHKTYPSNMIIITVGPISNEGDIKKICEQCNKHGVKCLHIRAETGIESINEAFMKASKFMTGQLHVDQL
jgi:Mg-chelatase subunit ChlD/predicted negative regulator of RcsB-dependent stress response